MEKGRISKKLPDAPGVYFFKKGKKVLYIGKATSLRSRVKSYFSKDIGEVRGPKIVKMLEEASSISFEQTDSVLEALILEANLIKQHQPLYNTDEKDDKSWNYVVITEEIFPRVLLVRGRNLEEFVKKTKATATFGPYPHGGQLKEALKIVRKIFPFFDTKRPVGKDEKRNGSGYAFNRQIGIYPKDSDPEAYAKTVRHIVTLFSGKKIALIKELEQDMKAAAKAQAFERAQEIKRQLFALQHIRDVSLIKTQNDADWTRKGPETFRVEGYDVAHLGGKSTVGVMAVIENGEPNKGEYRMFKIRAAAGGDDYAALTELLTRRFAHPEWRFPNLAVIDGGRAHLNAAAKAFRAMRRQNIPLISVVKDEKHRPREILGEKKIANEHEAEILLANAEAHRFAIGRHRSSLRKSIFR